MIIFNPYLSFFILILIFVVLLAIIMKNFIKGIKKKENIKDLLMKNRIYIFILILQIIGVTFARIKFYIDYGV